MPQNNYKLYFIVILLLLLLFLIIVTYNFFYNNLKPGTILFVALLDSSDFTKAILDSASNISKKLNSILNDLPIDHVALLLKNGKVIEATPEKGVTLTKVKSFLKNSNIIIAANIKDKNIEKQALKRAVNFFGGKYNYTFEPNSRNFYCSQLITESFLYANGDRYFSLYPMNFLDENGEFIPYWVDYYKKYNKDIPQGELGSHPKQLLLKTELFRKIKRIK